MPEFIRCIPYNDNRERLICAQCEHISYKNPKVVVGSVVVAGGRVLMCKRAIQPRLGFWTLPAGYLELGENLEEGVAREAQDEADVITQLDGILGVFSTARIGQVQVIFARFAGPEPRFALGPESQAVGLFAWDEILWQEIGFPSVRWALNAWRRVGAATLGIPASNPPDDPRGTNQMGSCNAVSGEEAGL